jgi:hypothetical protein
MRELAEALNAHDHAWCDTVAIPLLSPSTSLVALRAPEFPALRSPEIPPHEHRVGQILRELDQGAGDGINPGKS